MIKNDILDEIFNLNHRWECLTNDLFNDECHIINANTFYPSKML